MVFTAGEEVGTKFLIGKLWLGKVTWLKLIDKESFDLEWSNIRTTAIAYELNEDCEYVEVLDYKITMLTGGLDIIRNRMQEKDYLSTDDCEVK